MSIKTRLVVSTIVCSVCLLQYSCKPNGGAIEDAKSITGYYQTIKRTAGANMIISMELKKDSTAAYITDYKNEMPEVSLNGKWTTSKEDSSIIDIRFNDELMSFEKKEDMLDLRTNHNFGKIGLTELKLFKAVKPVDVKTLIVWVAPERGYCTGAADTKCLRIRWGNEDRGNYFVFQDSIKNFNYKEGVTYKLKVERKLKLGLPADSVAYEYFLKEELLKR